MKPRQPIKRKTPLKRTAIKPNAKNSIKPVADKRKSELAVYNAESKKWLTENTLCTIKWEGCTIKSSQVHHQKGRGIYLNIKKYWMSTCVSCHKKEVENSERAINEGVTIKRNDENYLLDLQKVKNGIPID